MPFNASFENVSSSGDYSGCYPCNPCTPDQTNDDGSQCYPCNPCSPDQLGEGGSQCYPCNPCGPDQRGDDGSQCYPCNPCSPDQTDVGGSQCYPCNPCSPDQGESSYNGGGSSGGCFITSACTESMGLSDRCEELQMLRVLRDKRVFYDDQFKALVKEYYIVAPKIVSAINRRSDRKELYADIYHEMVLPCVEMIKENRENEAVSLYTKYVYLLKARFLGAA